jgi:hypothetical protein
MLTIPASANENTAQGYSLQMIGISVRSTPIDSSLSIGYANDSLIAVPTQPRAAPYFAVREEPKT